MKKLERSILLVACLGLVPLISSCASKEFREPEVVNSGHHPTSRTSVGGMDKIWEATKDAMEERNMPVSQTNRDKGVIVTEWATGKSDPLFSRFGDSTMRYTSRFKYLVQVTETGSRTNVSIKSKEEYMTSGVSLILFYNYCLVDNLGIPNFSLIKNIKYSY